MKPVIKKILCVVLALVVICGIIVAPYGISFIKTQNEFSVEEGDFTENKAILNGEKITATLTGYGEKTENLTVEFNKANVGWFNYYGIKYSTDAYLKGVITYKCGVEEKSEEFFSESSENSCFYSFIDDFLKGIKGSELLSLSLEPRDKATANIKLS